MLRTERQLDPVDELRHLAEATAGELRVAGIGLIQSFDPDTITATIQLVGKETTRRPDGYADENELPLLEDVPVMFPGCRDFVITLPLQEGDEVDVIFQDRAIDSWWQSGGIQPQIESRMHDLSDAVAFPRVYSQSTKIQNVHKENIQIRTADGENYIEITPDGKINIKGDVFIDGDVHNTGDMRTDGTHTDSRGVHH